MTLPVMFWLLVVLYIGLLVRAVMKFGLEAAGLVAAGALTGCWLLAIMEVVFK